MTAEITQLVLPLSLFCIMTGVGLSLQWRDFYVVLSQPRVLIVGLLLQLLLLPVLALAVTQLFPLPAALAAGLLIVSLAPGGATSNMITMLVRGDTALSVSLTAVTSLLTPLTLPVAAWFMLSWVMPERVVTDFPVLATAARLLMIAVLPILLGMLIRHYAPVFSAKMQTPVRLLAMLFLVVVVVGIVSANSTKLASIMLTVGPAALMLICAALMLGWSLARWSGSSREQSITLAVETGIQNAGTALLVTGSILQDPQMSASALCYGVVMNLPVLVLVIYRNLPQKRVARVRQD